MTEDLPLLGRATTRAAAWAFVSNIGARVVMLAGLTVLARMLVPREFGLLAFAMTYILYAETIGDLGSGAALVYWPDRREEAAQVTFIINVIAGLGWCAVTLLLAPWVAAFFHAPEGTPIVRVLAFSLFFKFLGNTHDALAQKDLRFRARAVPELALALIKMGLAIVLAGLGFGAWSLVWGHLAGMAGWTIFLWIVVPWRPTWSFPRDLFRPILHYGRGMVFVNVITAVEDHADFAVIGRFIGLTALGLYQMASKIPDASVTVIVRVVSRVLFPAFSRMFAAGEDLKEAYLVASRAVAAITIPMVTGICLLAQPIVLLFFGPRWKDAAPIVSVLAILAGIQALATHAGDVLKGTGRARTLATLELIRLLMIVPALFIGARTHTAVGVALAVTVADGLATIVAFLFASRVIDVPLRAVARALAPSFFSAGVMAVLLWVWLRVAANLPVQLFGGVALGMLAYVAMLWFSDREMLLWARQHLLSRRKSAAEATS